MIKNNNTHTLILLCGQGSSGKSTYGKKLSNFLINQNELSVNFIRVDNLRENYLLNDFNIILKLFAIQIKNSIKNYNYTICDYAFDSIYSRQLILQKVLKNNKNIHLIIIYLLPDLDTIIAREKKRNKNLTEENIQNSTKAYKHKELPTLNEFIPYNIEKIDLYQIDNNIDISQLDVSYIFKKDQV